MAVVAMAGVSSADILFDSAFDGNTGAPTAGYVQNVSGSTTVGITDWITDASVTVISGLTAISPGGGFMQISGSAFANPDNVYINQQHGWRRRLCGL